MGLRDWPSTIVGANGLDEEVQSGARRYVLEGSGTVSVSSSGEQINCAPNTLVTVDADCSLRWQPSDAEMVLLTPEYKGPPLLPIVGGMFAVFTALIVATTAG